MGKKQVQSERAPDVVEPILSDEMKAVYANNIRNAFEVFDSLGDSLPRRP